MSNVPFQGAHPVVVRMGYVFMCYKDQLADGGFLPKKCSFCFFQIHAAINFKCSGLHVDETAEY